LLVLLVLLVLLPLLDPGVLCLDRSHEGSKAVTRYMVSRLPDGASTCLFPTRFTKIRYCVCR